MKLEMIYSSVGLVMAMGAGLLQAAPLDGRVAPDVGAGYKRAQMCFMCHGENGHSRTPGTPNLACQDRGYLEKAIRDYREGDRKDASMSAMVQPLTDGDIRNVAAYFSLLACSPDSAAN